MNQDNLDQHLIVPIMRQKSNLTRSGSPSAKEPKKSNYRQLPPSKKRNCLQRRRILRMRKNNPAILGRGNKHKRKVMKRK